MLQTFIAIFAIVVLMISWIISTQRKLVVLDENISNAMIQIGVQLSGQFDALNALLEVTKGYAKHESETLTEAIRHRRCMITAKSTPNDVINQNGVISLLLDKIVLVADKYPEIKDNQEYLKALDAVSTFDNMLRTSQLIYNDSVNKLNREVRQFPVFIIARMLGFVKRDYLEAYGEELQGKRDKNRSKKRLKTVSSRKTE